MERKVRVLHLKDVYNDELSISGNIEQELFCVFYTVLQTAGFMDAIESFRPHILLVDLGIQFRTAQQTLRKVRSKYPDLPVILTTWPSMEEPAILLLNEGAQDYVFTDRLKRLPTAIRRLTSGIPVIDRDQRELVFHASHKRPKGLRLENEKDQWLPGRSDFLTIHSSGRLVTGLKPSPDLKGTVPVNFKYLLEQSSMVAVMNNIWTIVEVNDSYCNLMQMRQEELLGKGYWNTIFSSHPRPFVNDLLHQIASGKIWKGELTGKAADGRRFWVRATIIPVMDEYNKPYQFIDIRTDITEEKLAKKENASLKEQLNNWDDRLVGLIRQSEDIIALYDKDLKPVYQNDALSSLLGRQVCREALNCVGFDDQYLEPALKEAIANPGKTVNIRLRATHTDGYVVWLEGYMVNLLDDPSMNAIVLNLRDHSRSIAAEQQLRHTEDMYHQIVETTEEGIWMINEESDTCFVNEKMALMLEYTVAEMNGKHISCFMDEAWSERASKFIEERVEGKKAVFEFRFRTRSGRKVWFLLSATPRFNEKGIYIGAMVMATDITERKNSEEAIRKLNKELKTLSAHLLHIREEERIEIARDIHDELGQQLTVLKMGLSWLHKKTLVKDPDLEKRGQDLLHLTDKTISTVRRIASSLRPEILDELGLIPAMKWLNKEITERYPLLINFHASMPSITLPPAVITGLFRIYQESLTNIIRHANAYHIHSTIKAEGNVLVLTVSDDGRGFKKETVGNEKKLGILGIRERVYSLEGIFDLVSEPSKGTQLTITIPIKTT